MEWKNLYFFIDPQKTKVDQNCYSDLLKTSLLPECRRLFPGNDSLHARQCLSHRAKGDTAVLYLLTNGHHILQILTFRSLHFDILQDLVYKSRRLPFASLQDLKEAIKNKWKGIPLRQFENPLHNEKDGWMRLESGMEARFSTFSINCSETCLTYWLFCTFRAPSTFFCVFYY